MADTRYTITFTSTANPTEMDYAFKRCLQRLSGDGAWPLRDGSLMVTPADGDGNFKDTDTIQWFVGNQNYIWFESKPSNNRPKLEIGEPRFLVDITDIPDHPPVFLPAMKETTTTEVDGEVVAVSEMVRCIHDIRECDWCSTHPALLDAAP